MDTNLSRNIILSDSKSQYDSYCKTLLSDKNILAWILKSTVNEYAACSIEEIRDFYIEGIPSVSAISINAAETNSSIIGMRNEDTIPSEGRTTYDIIFYALSPISMETKKIIIDIEAQNNYYPGYPIPTRGIFNGCRMISAQCERDFSNSHYEKINKVYSIWICMKPPARETNSIGSIHFIKEDLLGMVHIGHTAYDLITVLLIRLGGEKYPNYVGIIKLLDTLLSPVIPSQRKHEILQNEFNIPMTITFEKEINNMCNLSEGIYNDGFSAGFNDGISQSFEAITQVCKELKLSKEDTLNKALNSFKLPSEDIRQLIERYW